MRLSFRQVSIGAIISSLLATIVLFIQNVVVTWATFPPFEWLFFYLVLAVFAWPFCWIALTVGTLALTEARAGDWIWEPVPATIAGAIIGLIVGLGIAIPIGLVPWIGVPYGAATGLVAALMFQRAKKSDA